MNQNAKLDRRVSELGNQVASLYRTVIDLQDRLGGHELEENKMIVKAANTALSGPTQSNDTLMRRLNGFEGRFAKLEATLKEAGEEKALGVLAKAANATKRLSTPEGILERAERVLTDPSAVGTVAGYIANGQLAKAADVLKDAEAREGKEAEDGALERVENQMEGHRQVALVSELGEKVVSFERTLNALMSRLTRLEGQARQTAAPQTAVAKAGSFARRQTQETDYRDTPEGLLSRLEAVVDSPARVGSVASMIQGGQIDQARRIIEAAELNHETAMKKRDRRTL